MARIPPPAAAAGGAEFFWHPEMTSPKTIQVCPIKRFKTITLTCCIRCAAGPGSGRRVGFDEKDRGNDLTVRPVALAVTAKAPDTQNRGNSTQADPINLTKGTKALSQKIRL